MTIFLNLIKVSFVFFSCLFLSISCQKPMEYYSNSDFESIKKIDAHLHINTDDARYLEFAAQQNFRILSPNVDAGVSIDE